MMSLKGLLDSNVLFEECIRSISSEWMLEKYCVDELDMILPADVPLLTWKKRKGQVISVHSSTKLTAKDFKERRGLNEDKVSVSDDILQEFTDGEMFRTNPHVTFNSLRLHF